MWLNFWRGEFCLISRGFGRDGNFWTTWKPCERDLQSGIWDKVANCVDIPDTVKENATEKEFNCSALCRPTKVLLHPPHHWTLSKSGKGAILLLMLAVSEGQLNCLASYHSVSFLIALLDNFVINQYTEFINSLWGQVVGCLLDHFRAAKAPVVHVMQEDLPHVSHLIEN